MDSVVSQERIEPDIMVLKLVGRLTGQHGEEFRRQVEDLVNKKERKVILDFSGLEFMDSPGLSVLISSITKFVRSDATVVGTGSHGKVYQVIKAVNLGYFIPLYPSREEAVANLNA